LTTGRVGNANAVPKSVIELATNAAQIQRPEQALEALAELRERLLELEELHVEDALRRGHSWSTIAASLGVTKQAVHKKYAKRLGAGLPASPQTRRRGMLITAEARRAVLLARREAAALGDVEADTQHLLLGLLRDSSTCAAQALVSLGVTLDDARAIVRSARPRTAIKGRSRVSVEKLPVSQEARAAFDQALREAVRGGSGHLASEHLLLALVRGGGDALQVLKQRGVMEAALEERVQDLVDRRRTERIRANKGRNVRTHA
jgi:ATP-dependent Clp protease ATP-binding subunit ClpA